MSLCVTAEVASECPGWCAQFHCDGSAWCLDAIPTPCRACPIKAAATRSRDVRDTTVWEVHHGKNCWWAGHGADELDEPPGSSVPGVYTREACKASCSEYDGPKKCDGVIFQPNTQLCFRKANIDVARCSPDPSYVLFIRGDHSHALQPTGALSADHSRSPQVCFVHTRIGIPAGQIVPHIRLITDCGSKRSAHHACGAAIQQRNHG